MFNFEYMSTLSDCLGMQNKISRDAGHMIDCKIIELARSMPSEHDPILGNYSEGKN